MSDAAPLARPADAAPTAVRQRRRWWTLVALLCVALLAGSAMAAAVLQSQPMAGPALRLPAEPELDDRWGTYLSERQWGNPREAIAGDGWGLSWRGAIDTEYRFGEDGIAGLSDRDDEFRLGWAFWDERQPHVTERLWGATNPQGESGETILEDRVFHENTPNHAYSRLTYRYPPDAPAFAIELESAKYDSTGLTMAATVTNTTDAPRALHVVLKAWLDVGGHVEPLADGLLLHGARTAVAVVGNAPHAWQISADKAALDTNLREGGLQGGLEGHIGAISRRLELAPAEVATVRFAFAESPLAEAASSADEARTVLARSAAVVSARRSEAEQLFAGRVSEHEPLYRQALMSLLWNESHYRWDGTTQINPSWAGRVDARDVLILPDKWEYPWIAAWDSAFHAVTAALIDPELGAEQLRFLLSDRWQQPDGHIPCAEWVMDLECPPLFAWATWRIYELSRDQEFLTEMYPGLQKLYDYWWRDYLVDEAFFTGGFLGMDNLPRGPGRPQADASAWMAFFARDMARIASELADTDTAERYWLDRGRGALRRRWS